MYTNKGCVLIFDQNLAGHMAANTKRIVDACQMSGQIIDYVRGGARAMGR